MNLRQKLLQGSGLLMGGQVTAQGLSFLRNIVVARIVSPADFGIAATFVLAMGLLDMISNLSVDRLLVQSDRGDEPRFQATAQAFQVMRGLATSATAFCLAWPVSRLFGIPEALWAFQTVSLVPLIRGFMHLDPKRFHRSLHFGRDVATDVAPQALSVAIAWPLGQWLDDYSLMLWLLILQAAGAVAVSHLLASRRYAWAWDYGTLKRMSAFGWPLLLNGVLMFASVQGDRVVIGAAYDMQSMALYAVAYSLTWMPAQMLAKVGSALFLPVLARDQANRPRFERRYSVLALALSLVGIAVAAMFIYLGPLVVRLTYGPKYSGVGALISWLGVVQLVRTCRLAPTIASMSLGDTFSILLANVGCASGLALCVVVAALGQPLVYIAIAGLCGESLALAILVGRLRLAHGLPASLSLKGFALVVGLACAGVLVPPLAAIQASWTFAFVGTVVLVAVSALALAAVAPELRRAVRGTGGLLGLGQDVGHAR